VKESLSDKVAIVTGAAGGIGRVVVRGLLGEGAHVVALDVNPVTLDRLAGEFQGDGHADSFLAQVTDVADPVACEQAVDHARDRFGNVHILINNAGLGMGVVREEHMDDLVKTHEITPEMWKRIVDVNLSGAFYMTRVVIPHLLTQRWGRLINVTTSFFTMLRCGFNPYGSSKAGLEAMSSGHSKEFKGTGVTVNVVVPGGPTKTAMLPRQAAFDRDEALEPDVMVPPILWLCSQASDEVTGNRYVAGHWDANLPADAAAAAAAAPIGWPELAQNPVWPGGKPIEP